jgi:hypothetical protein
MNPDKSLTLGPPSKQKLAMTTAVAIGVAAILLFTIVLPFEYGIDPLRTGAALGLKASSAPPEAISAPIGSTAYKPVQEGPIAYYAAAYQTDSTEFTLGPYEYVEYKYRLESGAAMLYSWKATGPVNHDFHGERDGNTEAKKEESFDKKNRREGHGTFTAPFSGIHGWYWENPGGETIKVALTSAGFYSSAVEFRFDRTRHPHELTPLKSAPSSLKPGSTVNVHD